MTIHNIIDFLNTGLAIRRSFLVPQIEAAKVANSAIKHHTQVAKAAEQMLRPYNEALAITKTIREIAAPQINLQELTRLHREAIEQLQRNLSLIHTLHYTRTIESERSGAPTLIRRKRSRRRANPPPPPQLGLPRELEPEPKPKVQIGFHPPRKKSQP